MKLTRENIHALGTKGVGFTNQQLALLGIEANPSRGWISRLVGREIDDSVYAQALALRGSRSRSRWPASTPAQSVASSVPAKTTTDRFIAKYLRAGYPAEWDEMAAEYECCDKRLVRAAMKAMSYPSFLASIVWKTISRRVKALAMFRCRLCGGSEGLCTHHRDYLHRGYELDLYESELVCLCEKCHANFHGKK
jgi:hypothetical protein